MPPRTRKIFHDDETRMKIQAANIIHRMQQCIEGKVELNPQQVSCCSTLLNKVLPNLNAVDAAITHDAGDSLKAALDWVSKNGTRAFNR